MDLNTVLLSAITALIGGFIGTFLGTFLITKKSEIKMKMVRKVAIKGLDIIKKYASDKLTYCNAQDQFNKDLNIVEKRTVLVCLHKLGIPIENPIENEFDIKNIKFLQQKINEDEIAGMKIQINEGHCDHLFYIDVDTYFTENTRIKSIRNIAQKYITDVFAKTKRDADFLKYPENWVMKFSHGERRVIGAFIDSIVAYEYFDKITGEPITERIEQLLLEVKNGLWDGTLQWDYNAYQNILAQRRSAEELPVFAQKIFQHMSNPQFKQKNEGI